MVLASLALLAAGWGSGTAAEIIVPNASFESPSTAFADPRIDFWQKTPKPFWYEETEENKWDYLTGVFLNTPAGTADHIDNVEGEQATFLFAVPEAGFFQDYTAMDWDDPAPTHAFDARFEIGKSYQLTVGVVGGGGGMTNGSSLELALYYRDAASNLVTVAKTDIVYSSTLFPTTAHLLDFTVEVPPVQAGTPWAGQHIGVLLRSTAGPGLTGGYWDLDNIRLVSALAPALRAPAWTNGQFSCLVESEPGTRVEMLAALDPGLPALQWTRLGTLTNLTGQITFADPTADFGARFYRAVQLP